MAQTKTVKGFVARIFEKSGQGKRGPWTAYSIKVVDENGQEDPAWYQFGFEAPPFKDDAKTDGHGDYIQFDAEMKDAGVGQYVKGTGKILKSPPARNKGTQAAKTPGNKAQTVKQSELFGEIGGYNTEDDVRRMSTNSSRDAAIEAVRLLLEHDALPVTVAKTKAGQAKRYDEITAAIDKLTVKFFYDTASGRILESVQDEGAEVAKTAPLPDDADETEETDGNTQGDSGDLPDDPDGVPFD